MLEEANVAIDRPGDYFAEMVKSDEHMEYIRLKLAKQKRRLERIDEKKRETELKVRRLAFPRTHACIRMG